MGELSNTTINGVSYDFKDAGAARQSHSHTKSQITDFPTSMPASDVSAWAKASTKPTYTASEVGAIATTEKGAANGVASLDSTGKVPSSQLPSYVDDVLEYSAKSSFPATGETGKIYVDTSTDKTYRWSGSAYVEISESLALGETSSTAYRGDRGKAAYDHSQVTSGNPHNVTKTDVGLSNVGNFKAVSTVASQVLSDTEKSNARANIGAGTGNGTYSKPSGGIPKTDLASAVQTSLGNADTTFSYINAHPFFTIPINRNMVYRGNNLGATLTDLHHLALSTGNFTDLYLGDYWTKSVTIPAGTYTDGGGASVTVPAQTVTLKAVIADFDTFYAGYASTYAGINTHHAAVIVTGFSKVVWNSTSTTAGGYTESLINKWLVGSVLPQMETWFGSAKVLSHKKYITTAITGDTASGSAWSSQKISLLSENQVCGPKVWGNNAFEPGEAFKHLNIFNHIDANLLFGNKDIWLRNIASSKSAASLYKGGNVERVMASNAYIYPAALILLS